MERVSNFLNRLIIDGDGCALLAHEKDINDVLTLDDGSDVFHLENGCLSPAYGDFTENEFTEMYAEDENGDYEMEDLYGKVKRYCKVDFFQCDLHYTRLTSAHGIRTSEYDITNSDIISVDVYRADNYIPQDYPKQEGVSFYKAIAEDGKAYYLKRFCQFFPDDSDDAWEMISEAEFNEYK